MRKIFILTLFYLGCVRHSLLGFMPRLKNPYVYIATTDVIVLPEDYEEDIMKLTSNTVSVSEKYKESDELYIEVDTEPLHWVQTSFANTKDEMEFENPLFFKKINKERLINHSKTTAHKTVAITSETQSSANTLIPEQYIMNDDWPATPPHYVQTGRLTYTTELLTSKLFVTETRRGKTWRSYFPTKASKTLVAETESVYDQDLIVTWKQYIPWRKDNEYDYAIVDTNYRRTYSPVVQYNKPFSSDINDLNYNVLASKSENNIPTITEEYRRINPIEVQEYKQPSPSELRDFKPEHVFPKIVGDYRRTYPPEVQYYKHLDRYEPYRKNLLPLESQYGPYKKNLLPLEGQYNMQSIPSTERTTKRSDPALELKYLMREVSPHFLSLKNKTDLCYHCVHSEKCTQVFDQENMIDRHLKKNYVKQCSGETFIGGCYKRYLDVGESLSERGCRHIPPEKGSSFASLGFKRLEYLLVGITEGCTSSPVAGLIPLSRPVSLYVRFHVCVCVTSLCNSASMLLGKFSSSLFCVLYFVCFILYLNNKYL